MTMSEETDITERARIIAYRLAGFDGPEKLNVETVGELLLEEASEIFRLRGEVERLTAANRLWVPTTEYQVSGSWPANYALCDGVVEHVVINSPPTPDYRGHAPGAFSPNCPLCEANAERPAPSPEAP